MRRLPARALLIPGSLLLAGGLVLLTQLTPTSGHVPLILLAEVVQGFGAGLNGTPAVYTALSGVRPADTGVTSAMSSTSNQIGASVGTAVLSSIAASATASYLAANPTGAATGIAIVHGFATATAVGAALLFCGAVLVGLLVNVDPRQPG
jgi:hypothetical protein